MTWTPFQLVLTHHTLAAASAERVWAVFADIEDWPRWNRACRSVRVLEGTPWEPGFRFHLVLWMAGVPVPFEPVLQEVTPERRVVWSSTRFTITGRRTFTFSEAVSGRTAISDQKLFMSPLLPLRLFYPRPVIDRMSRTWLESLAREAERQEREQAGRQS